jgi:integrase
MGDLEDFQGFGQALENELGKLDRHHDEDLPLVKRWITKTDKRVAESTLSRYLKDLRKTAERLDRPIATLSEAEMDAHVYDLRRNPEWGRGGEPLSDATVRNVEFVIRKFLSTIHADDDDHWAHEYELTPQPQNTVTAEDMLRSDDIQALTQHATNLRDVAMIEFLADTGARLSLVGSLRVCDVDLDGDRCTFTPNPNATGLKGADITEYPIIDAAAILRNYLHQVHPRPHRDDVALFHKMPGHGNDIDEGDGALRCIVGIVAVWNLAGGADPAGRRQVIGRESLGGLPVRDVNDLDRMLVETGLASNPQSLVAFDDLVPVVEFAHDGERANEPLRADVRNVLSVVVGIELALMVRGRIDLLQCDALDPLGVEHGHAVGVGDEHAPEGRARLGVGRAAEDEMSIVVVHALDEPLVDIAVGRDGPDALAPQRAE